MNAFKASAAYFAIVFASGFLLGMVRVPLLVPRLGARTSELLEMPLMFVAILLAARYVMHKFELPQSMALRLLVGTMALALMLCAELSVVLWMQGLTLADYLARRDPISGTVYLFMLGVFAAMPLLVSRR